VGKGAMMDNWWLIFGLAGITFSVRFLFFIKRLPVEFGPKAERFLSYSAPAVLTGLIVPILLMPSGSIDISFSNAHLVAGLFACVLGFLRLNILLTVVLSMMVFLVLQAW
jgi:branched-subunit amino acid transport protein